MKQPFIKKFSLICLSIVLLGGLIKYIYISKRCTNINYAVQNYFTTGVFNNYKMYKLDTINLSFSNGTIAMVKIDGLEQKSPHKKVAYSVFLEKNSRGIWKVQKIYPAQVVLKTEH